VTLVVDASVLVAALVDGGPMGRWAEEHLLSDHLAAPHLLPVEVANILRREAGYGEGRGEREERRREEGEGGRVGEERLFMWMRMRLSGSTKNIWTVIM
jgi:predicted nucleic acid-binding protein